MKTTQKSGNNTTDNKSASSKSYNRLAHIYQLLENLVFANNLHKARIAHINQLKAVKTVLILGEGDGRFLKVLLELNPSCQVDCLDNSAAMLSRAEQRLTTSGIATTSINFIHSDALNHDYIENTYDAVVTLFFLDNFTTEQLESLIPTLITSLKENGKWLVTDFQQPAKGLMYYLGSSLLWIMYRFFRWQTDIPATTLANPKPFLGKEMAIASSKRFLGSLLYSELWLRDASTKYTSTQARVSR